MTPITLDSCIEADVAGGTRRNPAPEGQFVCATRASRAWLWEAEHGRNQPEAEHDCSDHQETLDHVRGGLGKDPDKCDRQSSHQEKSAAAGNSQLQSEVVAYAHGLMVPARCRCASAFTSMSGVGIYLCTLSVVSASCEHCQGRIAAATARDLRTCENHDTRGAER
jgi:hypothetical protein